MVVEPITTIGGAGLRPNVKNMNDINYNFNMLRWLVGGHIDHGNINEDAIDTLHVRDLAVTNAKIESMIADKIDAGTIWAQIWIMAPIIVGGRIMTNLDPGRRIEMRDSTVLDPPRDYGGVFAYDASDYMRFELSERSISGDDITISELRFWRNGTFYGAFRHTMILGGTNSVGIRADNGATAYLTSNQASTYIYSDPLEKVHIQGGHVEIHADPLLVYGDIGADTIVADHLSTNTIAIGSGFTGSFVDGDGNTVNVDNGIITSVVSPP